MDGEKQGAGSSIAPRLVIHGGAGNIVRHGYPVDKYLQYREALLRIVSNTNAYMTTAISNDDKNGRQRPSALQIATHAVRQLEDDALFNSGHGAVFTRDGTNELEASVMVSRGLQKRAVGVMGLRRVRNPIVLARRMLEHGEQDLGGGGEERMSASSSRAVEEEANDDDGGGRGHLDVPSAQGHTQIYGEAAEILARRYGCRMVEPGYFFTRQRWDEHVRGLERERRCGAESASWAADEFLPQGTCGAVALDEWGVVCAATSTGGMTNKLSGRVGDTPVPGAGFWAEEWAEQEKRPDDSATAGGRTTARWQWGWWDRLESLVSSTTNAAPIEFAGSLRGFLADCLPTPFMYVPVPNGGGRTANDNHSGSEEIRSAGAAASARTTTTTTTTTRSFGASGTGNGDSFLRLDAVRTIAAMARWKPESSARALRAVAGPGGTLQQSAGERWGVTGEGEGGVIGIEGIACVRRRRRRRHGTHGHVQVKSGENEEEKETDMTVRGEILMDYNCGGMYRAWIDEQGQPVMSIWSNTSSDEMPDGDKFE